MSEHPITDAHDEAYTQVSYQELAGRFEAESARLAAELATTTEKIDYSDKGVLDALLRENARLAAEMAEARDALKAVWPFIEFHVGCVGHIKGFQEALDKVKAQVSK